MRRAARRVGAVLFAAALGLGIAALSRVPYGEARPEGAVLRLSWRTRGDLVRECRKLTPEELAALPVHMRRTEVCEGRVLSRHLQVEIDGRLVLADTVRAAGARGDRPLYVFHEIPLSPGAHRLRVAFASEPSDAARPAEPRPSEGPRHLELDTRLAPDAGEVVLVTYDPDRAALVLRGPESEDR